MAEAVKLTGGNHELLKLMIALRQSEISSVPERLRAEAARLEVECKRAAMEAGVAIARIEAETKRAVADTEAQAWRDVATVEVRALELKFAEGKSDRIPPASRKRALSDDEIVAGLSALPVDRMHSLSAAVWEGRPSAQATPVVISRRRLSATPRTPSAP